MARCTRESRTGRSVLMVRDTGVAFHQLEAELAAVGQARSGQLQAGVVQVLFRHGDATGGRVERERDLRGAQQVGRFSGRLLVQAGIQRAHARLR
ncbi:hypothetical protein G6F63_016407 [Rhizopus arrhizus]|nr:hypothetical protein G6F63_016407 [Rhizopus arrhizus]